MTTVKQIYKSLSHQMLKGIMLHSDMVDYYKFLSLDGYAKCHEYRMIAESRGYRKLRSKYLCLYDQLIQDDEQPTERVVPDTWYVHVRQDVDAKTVKEAVKDGLSAWIDHEVETKRLYEQSAKELRDLGDIDSAMFVEELICGVSKELKKAKKYHLNKEHTDYDLPTMIEEQHHLHDKYECKIHECYGK